MENALCRVTDYIVGKFDIGHKTLGIFLDLSKAFDTVSHRIMLERLKHIGIRGTILQLFSSFLSGRTQRVKIEDSYSPPLSAEFGVPQGTVLGPVLFTIYILMKQLKSPAVQGLFASLMTQ